MSKIFFYLTELIKKDTSGQIGGLLIVLGLGLVIGIIKFLFF
jgi:hypothetical protein